MARTPTSARRTFAGVAPAFAALGDETRLAIVASLCARGPQSIVQLTDEANVSRQAVTKHLHALSRAGLARSTREGRQRIWEIQTQRLADARRCLDQISSQWDAAIARLQAFVEEP